MQPSAQSRLQLLQAHQRHTHLLHPMQPSPLVLRGTCLRFCSTSCARSSCYRLCAPAPTRLRSLNRCTTTTTFSIPCLTLPATHSTRVSCDSCRSSCRGCSRRSSGIGLALAVGRRGSMRVKAVCYLQQLA